MKEIFQYIDELDKSGNYRLADKIENDVKKVYAQALTSSQFPPGYADFVLKQMVLKQISQPKKDTDTLSPTKNPDIATMQKKLNDLTSKFLPVPNQIKKLNQNYDMIPNLASMVGNQSEKIDEESGLLTDHTNRSEEHTSELQSH